MIGNVIDNKMQIISIPAPARGRTRKENIDYLHQKISIPAPARGRTFFWVQNQRICRRFQFPPPRGGELIIRLAVIAARNFNSRPREGANSPLPDGQILGSYFNSRPREGANEQQFFLFFRLFLFQFPPPRGGEPLGKKCLIKL